MKTEIRNSEQYVAPEVTQIGIVPEGMFCDSGGVTEEGDWNGPGA